MIQKFMIAGRLPGMNDILLSRGRGHYAWAAKKKRLEEELAYEIYEQKIKPVSGAAAIRFHWYEKNSRRDPDNISGGGRKIILDALVKYGILENDSQKIIRGLFDEFHIDPDRPRIEVEIIS